MSLLLIRSFCILFYLEQYERVVCMNVQRIKTSFITTHIPTISFENPLILDAFSNQNFDAQNG